MVRSMVVLALLAAACGSSYSVSPPPDMRISLDLAVSPPVTSTDMSCLNTACGGCSSWLNWDGTPSKEGDPCLWKGVYQCNGTALVCSDTGCLACTDTTKQPVGTVCGADGHTIVELTYAGNACSAYDFGSAIGLCNRAPGDHCVQRCTGPNGNVYDCVAHCTSDDGGGTGCDHMPTDTCESLKGC
jgi:hypothetical protein